MTRQDFIDTVEEWSELIDFCAEEGLLFCEDIFSDDEKDDYVDNHLDEICDDGSWQDVLNTLRNIPSGYNYYIKDADLWMEFEGVEDYGEEFRSRKQEILEYMDNHNRWDDDDEFEDGYFEDENIEEPEDEFDVDTSLSLNDFFASNAIELKKIADNEAKAEAKTEADFNKFIAQSVAS